MSRGLRFAVYLGGAVLLLAVLVASGIYGFSARALASTWEIETRPLQPSAAMSEAGRIAHGEHVAHIRGCVDCHAEDGGGAEFSNDLAFGLLWATNLTSGEGGIAASYSEEDWDLAVRHGVGPDDRPLVFMPSYEYWYLSDDDLAALIAYYRSLPPVDRAAPDPRPALFARLLYLTGELPLVPADMIDHEATRPRAPEPAPTAEFGEYLAHSCTGCHGPGLSGGRIPGTPPDFPPAQNITPHEETGIGSWSFEDFDRAMRDGVRPDGSRIDPSMPVQISRHLTPTEMEALYAFLRTVEPKRYGGR